MFHGYVSHNQRVHHSPGRSPMDRSVAYPAGGIRLWGTHFGPGVCGANHHFPSAADRWELPRLGKLGQLWNKKVDGAEWCKRAFVFDHYSPQLFEISGDSDEVTILSLSLPSLSLWPDQLCITRYTNGFIFVPSWERLWACRAQDMKVKVSLCFFLVFFHLFSTMFELMSPLIEVMPWCVYSRPSVSKPVDNRSIPSAKV